MYEHYQLIGLSEKYAGRHNLSDTTEYNVTSRNLKYTGKHNLSY